MAHSMCADRVRTCSSLGNNFRNARFTYFDSDAGELVVDVGQRVVIQQAGGWQ